MVEKDLCTSDIVEDVKYLSNRYRFISKIGEGTFSSVYKAVVLPEETEPKYVAIKAITKTTSPSRVVDELSFLKKLKGMCNIIELLACYRHEDQVCAVFPYFEVSDFRSFLMTRTPDDVKHYMYNLVLAVNSVHMNKIIHRDVKPSNFLYNKEKKRGVLIDFGLAQYDKFTKRASTLEDVSNKKATPVLFFNSIGTHSSHPPGYYIGDTRPTIRVQRAGTKGFRAPEVLFRYSRQTTSVDVWSMGVIFLILCTKQYPFFNSGDDADAIVEIATIFGHDEMRKAAKFFGRVWRSNLSTIPNERIPFEKLVRSLSPDFQLSQDGYDLLGRMLDLNSDRRITAEEALNHPFFNGINPRPDVTNAMAWSK